MASLPAIDLSIIVAVKNGDQTLQRCISSILPQTGGNIELIVIDGASTDRTVEILRANQDSLAYWISEPDRGICDAWNKGLAQAKGEWLLFLGADDYLWSPEVLAMVAPALRSAFPQYSVAYGRVACVDASGAIQGVYGQPWNVAKAQFLVDMSIPHQGTFHHRSLFEKFGVFDRAFRIAGDYELLLRELSTADALFLPQTVVAGMQIGGLSSNLDLAPSIYREFSTARRKHGLNPYPLAWQWKFAKAHVKRLLAVLVGAERLQIALRNFRQNAKPGAGGHD